MSSLRSPLGRVAGLGAARGGVQHWWLQRLTSIALVPLAVWFLVCLLRLPAFDHATVTGWMSQTWTAVLLILLLLVACWHSQIGIRVIVEDYVHGAGARTLTLVIVTFAHTFIAFAGVFAILKVAFGAAR
ncbi:MAG TPA: succinate dehydrogenase, hydrophobic membrane anchor protein [Steroidobacteraceae bacterium]|nr:succinate dehydrogenase, hydrophobic membrane anchor protein [Steroidobacteraceae bacterium]